MTDDRLLTIAETAAMLGVTIQTLRQWSRPGRAVHGPKPTIINSRGDRRFRLSDVVAFMETGDPL